MTNLNVTVKRSIAPVAYTAAGLASAAFFLYGCGAEQHKKQVRPNFLFILLDDQPYDALSYAGRYPFLNTPNIDRIAHEGVWFENAFCTASLSSPSRASFLTGTYPHVHGVTQNDHRVDPDWESFPPYPLILRKAGYETAMVGKIHMKLSEGKEHIRPGFDYWLSFQGQGDYINPYLNENGREFREEGYMTDILTEYAIDWLRNRRDRSKPFSLCVWHKAVHEPHSPAERHQGTFGDESLPEPPYGTAAETFAGKPEWQRIKAYDKKWEEYIPADSLPKKEWNPHNPKYLSLLECILAVDESTGKILEALEGLGELDNTVIIYSSDNGYFMGEHTYWDKRIGYESSIRIPLLIRYPDIISAGTIADELCLNIDLAPTILDLAGAVIPDYMQGASLVPLFDKKPDMQWRKSILFEYYVDDAYPYAGPDMLAVRTDSFKLVDCFLEHDLDELYDLKRDPGEMTNLINDPVYKNKQEMLRGELERLRTLYSYNPDRDWWLRKFVSGSDE
jgi:N-acetylglucosamine-6-sulfatase